MTDERIHTFEEFWPYYVGEHRDPVCRALHYVGTTLAIGTVATAVLTANPTWLLLTPVVGYAPAWFGHYIIEGNVPATFKHPIWSLRGDLRMLSMALQGRMAAEVERLYPNDCLEPVVPRRRAADPEQPHTNGATAP
jgi:hypothetical protein